MDISPVFGSFPDVFGIVHVTAGKAYHTQPEAIGERRFRPREAACAAAGRGPPGSWAIQKALNVLNEWLVSWILMDILWRCPI